MTRTLPAWIALATKEFDLSDDPKGSLTRISHDRGKCLVAGLPPKQRHLQDAFWMFLQDIASICATFSACAHIVGSNTTGERCVYALVQ